MTSTFPDNSDKAAVAITLSGVVILGLFTGELIVFCKLFWPWLLLFLIPISVCLWISLGCCGVFACRYPKFNMLFFLSVILYEIAGIIVSFGTVVSRDYDDSTVMIMGIVIILSLVGCIGIGAQFIGISHINRLDININNPINHLAHIVSTVKNNDLDLEQQQHLNNIKAADHFDNQRKQDAERQAYQDRIDRERAEALAEQERLNRLYYTNR